MEGFEQRLNHPGEIRSRDVPTYLPQNFGRMRTDLRVLIVEGVAEPANQRKRCVTCFYRQIRRIDLAQGGQGTLCHGKTGLCPLKERLPVNRKGSVCNVLCDMAQAVVRHESKPPVIHNA